MNDIDPDLIEEISEAVHANWMAMKLEAGVTSRLMSVTNEELMVPYRDLSEGAKELDRGTVRTVLIALVSLGYEIHS